MKRTVFALASVAGVLFGAGSGPALANVSIDSVPGSLPKTIAPMLYDIDVVPDLATMKIRGRETVTIDVLTPTDRVVVNALQTKVASATVDGVAATSVKDRAADDRDDLPASPRARARTSSRSPTRRPCKRARRACSSKNTPIKRRANPPR